MVDSRIPIEGFDSLWGHSIFQCPYCHGWEERDRRWAFLPTDAEHIEFAILLSSWTADVVVLTNGAFELPDDARAALVVAGVRIETERIARLRQTERKLVAAELESGREVPCDVLFAHPSQRQVGLVESLALAVDDMGYVQVDSWSRQTSVPGIYAAGDLTTRMQAAVVASANGMQAASAINHELTLEPS